MSKPTEQFTELHKKSIDAATRLAQMSLDNSKRIMELQVEIARSLFEESVKNAKALTETKDPQAALALRTQFAQETTQKMIEARAGSARSVRKPRPSSTACSDSSWPAPARK